MEKIKAIVFDWDGTIVNTMDLKKANVGLVFQSQYSVNPEIVSESYKKYSGISRRELFEIIAKEALGHGLSDMEFNHLSHQFTQKNLESYTQNNVFEEDNRNLLLWLLSNNIKLFVSSSAVQEEIESLAIHLDIKKHFTEMIGSKGPFKKGKSHIDYIKQKYHLSLNELIFIGDEKADMRLAGRLGLLCIGITQPGQEKKLHTEFADYTVNRLHQIKEILLSV